ncbi:MAG: type II secretion system F family protein, partial [Candidatus Eremiobacterota bacterium]
MGRYPRLFSPFFRAMVASAEESRDAPAILARLARWLETSARLRRRVNTALLYPAILLNLLALMLVYLGAYVGPLALPRLQAYPWVAGGAGVALLLGVNAMSLAGWMPGYGALRRLAEQAGWAQAVGALLAAGRDPVSAQEAALAVVSDSGVRHRLQQALDLCRRGEGFSRALQGLEPELIWYAEAGEQKEDLPSFLFEAARVLEERVDHGCRRLVRLAGPVGLALAGALILVSLAS